MEARYKFAVTDRVLNPVWHLPELIEVWYFLYYVNEVHTVCKRSKVIRNNAVRGTHASYQPSAAQMETP